MHPFRHLLLVSVLLLAGCAGSETFADPATDTLKGLPHVYLTYPGDTATSISINVQAPADIEQVTVHYGTLSADDPSDYPKRATGESHQIDGITDRRVHWITLNQLQPHTVYYFRVQLGDRLLQERAFRTLPADGRPVRLVTGGDMDTDEEAAALMNRAGKFSPAVAMIGGDIAYANGRLDAIGKWDRWLDLWERHMVTRDGLMIPMILAIGNHEVRGGWGKPASHAPFYYGFFDQGGRSYFSRRLGRRAVLNVLDTGHTHAYGGEQAEWLDQALASQQDTPYRFALYHVPLYPSHRRYFGDPEHAKNPQHQAHVHWLPLFDKHRLTTAFENHDHTLKRTHLMRGGQVAADGDGTLYLGDGCFGREPRSVQDRFYLKVQKSQRHFWVVDISAAGVGYRAVDAEGTVHDRYPEAR